MLKFGYAEVDITLYGPIETVGFNRKDNVSRGILKPLLAQVSVWVVEMPMQKIPFCVRTCQHTKKPV